MTRRRRVPWIVGSLLCLVASAAYADTKTTSGHDCVRANAVGDYSYDGIVGTDVYCPIVRDNTGNTNGLKDLEVNVTGGMFCTAYSDSPSGQLVSFSIKSRGGAGKIDFGSSLGASVSGGHHFVNCFGNARVVSLRWVEY